MFSQKPSSLLLIHLLIVSCLTLIFCFLNLGNFPLHEWDETRNGVNAIEMLHNADYFTLHYAGTPDNWSFKPPLFIWLTAFSFKLFGYNALALRFFPALFATFSLLLFWRIIYRYYGSQLATFTILILLSVKGIVGFHVGRTGDFDAPLLFFLLLGIQQFLAFDRTRKERFLYGVGMTWGIAFWIKGPAAVVLLPGIALFLLLNKQWKSLLLNRHFYGAFLLFGSIAASWLLITFLNQNTAGSQIFSNDLITRFTDTEFEKQDHVSYFGFFLNYLDACFNLWNYLFLAVCAYGLFYFKTSLQRLKKEPLLLLAISSWLTLGLFLSLAATTHRWYMAPALPFIALTTAYGLSLFMKKHAITAYLISGLLLFTLGRRLYHFVTPPHQKTLIEQYAEPIKNAKKVIQIGQLPSQQQLLQTYFYNQKIVFQKVDWNIQMVEENTIFLVGKDAFVAEKLRLQNVMQLGQEEYLYLLQSK